MKAIKTLALFFVAAALSLGVSAQTSSTKKDSKTSSKTTTTSKTTTKGGKTDNKGKAAKPADTKKK